MTEETVPDSTVAEAQAEELPEAAAEPAEEAPAEETTEDKA
jgi:hypothetical protein